MSDMITVSCGDGSGSAANVRSSVTKSTTRMPAGKTHGYKVPNGQNLIVERLGSAPVSIRNDSTRPASVSVEKPDARNFKLGAGKAHQLATHERLKVSL